MLHYNNINHKRSGWIVFTAPLALFVSLTGCSIVDSPPATVAPELDVRNFYMQLATKNIQYQYAVASTVEYYPATDTLAMNMQGLCDSANYVPLFSCLWTYRNYGQPTLWYYGLSDKQAINFGERTSGSTYADSWVDLQSPLQDSASWTFTSMWESITATVVQYGVSAQVEGKNYSDVAMVQYTGSNGTTGTEWFAKGTGLIYSNIFRPNYGKVENQLQSVIQK